MFFNNIVKRINRNTRIITLPLVQNTGFITGKAIGYYIFFLLRK